MSKLVTFFLLAFLGMALIGSIAAGGGGVVSTRLTTAMTATSTNATVASTSGFLNIDVIMIGDEKILYSSKDSTHFYFDVGNRGYEDTDAKSHSTGTTSKPTLVYTKESGTFNKMAGYNFSKIADASGLQAFINIPIAFLSALWNALTINFSFLGTGLEYVSYIYIALGIGFIVSLSISLFGGRRAGP